MDAATVLNTLRNGDIALFLDVMEWDATYIPVMPAGMITDGEMVPFLGLFGVVSIGAIQHEGGKYELRLHTHDHGEAARECFDQQIEAIKQTLAVAELMNVI
jgi:hypothetical protein